MLADRSGYDVVVPTSNFLQREIKTGLFQKLDKAVLDDPAVYPDAATIANLYTVKAWGLRPQRLINRLWTRVKTGQ